jgi:PIN domain nuclease of toxin-antitoxin system
VRALLLDTQVLLWWWSDDSRLGRQASRLIRDPTAAVYVSAATIWEIVIKVAKGKLRTGQRLNDSLPDALSADRLRPLPITLAHALALQRLPAFHRDPFDRILLAQADVEGLALVTADQTLMRYGVAFVPAID